MVRLAALVHLAALVRLAALVLGQGIAGMKVQEQERVRARELFEWLCA